MFLGLTLCMLSYVKGESKYTLTCDIDGQNVKYVFATKTPGLCLGTQIFNNVEGIQPIRKMSLKNEFNLDAVTFNTID